MEISLDQARSLCAVVENGGYSQAAEKLNKSHSSLIYMIKTFEEQIGLSLFDRGEYRNKLTPKGKRIYDKCRELLAKSDEISQLCKQLEGGVEPSLKAVFDGSLPFDPLIGLYEKFRRLKIATIVQTHIDYLEDVEKSFYAQNADLMISIVPVQEKGLEKKYLKKQISYLVAHKNHPLHAEKKTWSTNQLQDFNFLTIKGTGNLLGLPTHELEENASFFLSDFQVKKEAIMKQIGFGWLPQHLIEKELKNKTLIPVKWQRPSMTQAQPTLYFKKELEGGRAMKLILEHFI